MAVPAAMAIAYGKLPPGTAGASTRGIFARGGAQPALQQQLPGIDQRLAQRALAQGDGQRQHAAREQAAQHGKHGGRGPRNAPTIAISLTSPAPSAFSAYMGSSKPRPTARPPSASHGPAGVTRQGQAVEQHAEHAGKHQPVGNAPAAHVMPDSGGKQPPQDLAGLNVQKE